MAIAESADRSDAGATNRARAYAAILQLTRHIPASVQPERIGR